MFLLETHPIISIILSVLLINGFYNASFILSKNKKFLFLNNYNINSSIVFFFIVVNLLSIVFYNIFLIIGINKFFLQLTCIFFILVGFYKPYYLKVFFKNIFSISSKTQLLIYLILFFYFLLSLMPTTDPDSLEYHLTVPYIFLTEGFFHFDLEWIASQLVGAGEALITLAMSIKAFQFSGILQYFSLLLIIIIISHFDFKKINVENRSRNLIILCILCIPSFLFLVFTMKPTLFSISTNFLAFLLTVSILPNESNKKYSLYIYTIIIFLILCSAQFKYSFYLTAFIIGALSTYEMIKKKLFINTIAICLLLFILIVLPREYYDYKNLSPNIIQNFFNPVANINITDAFMSSMKHGPGNSRYSLYWLFVPIRNGLISPGMITEVLGISVLIFMFNLNLIKIEVRKILIIFCAYFMLAIIFGQPVGRFFIEPFLWAMFASLMYIRHYKNNYLFIFEKIIIVNSIVILSILIFTIVNFIPGLISTENYKNILKKYADGYLVYEWANKVLPENAILISTHRAYAFSKNEFISSGFRLYVRDQKDLDYFIKEAAKKKPTHILYLDHTIYNQEKSAKVEYNYLYAKHDYFYKCRGKLFAHGKGVGRIVGRNPLGFSKSKYDAYIYEIDLNKGSKCSYK